MKSRTLFSVALLCAVLCIVAVTSEAEEITLTLRAGEYSLKTELDGSVFIDMKGFGGSVVPGEPLLPMKTFMIALPPGSRVQNVRVEPDLLQPLPGTYRIAPATYMVEGGSDDAVRRAEQGWRKAAVDAYAKDTPYPAEIATFAGQGQWRRYA